MAVKPKQILISLRNMYIRKGSNYRTLKCEVSPCNASKSVRWECDNTDILKISPKGLNCRIHAVKTGTTKVHCISEVDSSVKVTCTVHVEFVDVESVHIIPSSMGLKKARKKPLRLS